MPLPDTNLPGERSRRSEWWRLGLAVVLGIVFWALSADEVKGPLDELAEAWIVIADPIIGLAALALVHWRHRWPMPVLLLTTALSVVSWSASGPAVLALCSIGARRRLPHMAIAGVAAVVASVLSEVVYDPAPSTGTPLAGLLLTATLATVAVLAIGYAVGSRREVIRTLRERAETAEREQATRVAAARVAERSRIAREMHDVLAHRISLVAMHASALGFRTDLPLEEQQAAIRTIEDNARQALVDLRDVLGVLRTPEVAPADGASEAPQPTLHDIDALVEEARATGMLVTVEDATTGEPATTTGRTAFRIVQEGLTNARKHAPRTHVRVALSGDEESGLTVLVRTPRPVTVGAPPSLPGAGLGLVGLRERTEIAGGRLRHEVDRAGDFVLTAWLPWG